MPQFIDLTGKRFGRWAVVERDGFDRHGQIVWECVCTCGTKRTVSGGNLGNGSSTSCGCYMAEAAGNRKRLPFGEAAFRDALRRIKNNAKSRQLMYGLTNEQAKELMDSNCFYCGGGPSNISRPTSRTHGSYVYNGIDRVDNTKGYILGNVVPCCFPCNWMKNILSLTEFKAQIKKLHNHLFQNVSSARIALGFGDL